MEWIYIILLAVGCFFLFTATLGLFLMPDVYTRMHATTKCDTVAAGCILTAVALRAGDWSATAKLLLVFFLILMISPTSAHLIAWTARQTEGEQKTEREAV
ncbi:MAG: monovalent cation/H(+) antiporter subunit G [Firmicutes bacterium]|jgi:multicomponent Na+:H+ antiporter subunit G|nr:monovalent cation/H(+) antiporter subunit G [Bacillota bacterium]HOB34990.1 monovalent cation/H(+) antiporter subunit G [Bacillota bacterium]HPZ90975.1 monovalent cation/H(+) antiporter subunit G [Bacillota bacterium]HQE02165.1 monovalent cation/H(+) antiporter subunit G [Bacillota bacterium]